MRMRSFVIAAALALTLAPTPAVAQMPAGALGQPLPKADLPDGTITVRVVQGDLSKPAIGVDVRLKVGGDVRTARTAADGRATFPGLPAGTRVQAAIDGASGEVTSSEFSVPGSGGTAVMLSTVPMAAPMAGGPNAPNPRQMAGRPRPDQSDPGGQVSVRLTYDDLADLEGTVDHPVVLVAYAADGRTGALVVRTGADARAIRGDLDTSGRTAYYALSYLPRGDGHDRLMSRPLLPNTQMGLRLLLSGAKRNSGEPPVDELSQFARQPRLPAGEVLVVFGGSQLPPDDAKVELIEIGVDKPLSTSAVRRGRVIESSIKGTFAAPQVVDTLAAGNVAVRIEVDVGRGPGVGLPQAPVRLRRANTPAGAAESLDLALTTDRDGKVTFQGAPTGVPLQVTVDVQGKTFTSEPFTLPADKGMQLAVTSAFEILSMMEAGFTGVVADPEKAYAAQVTVNGEVYRSPPFQMVPERGAVVPIYVAPRISLRFLMDAWIDDEYLAVRGTYEISNVSFAPWVGPSEGLRLPAPRGATGLGVADEDKPFVDADGPAFRLLRPVPPMGASFRAGFSLRTDGGQVKWDMALPLGTSNSSMGIRKLSGMQVSLPGGKQAEPISDGGVTWLAIRDINIGPDQRMVFTMTGLPRRATWHFVSKVAAGLSVLLLMGAGVGFALYRRNAPTSGGAMTDAQLRAQRRRRINELLDQLAEIDRRRGRDERHADDDAADLAKREALVRELEALYRQEPTGEVGDVSARG